MDQQLSPCWRGLGEAITVWNAGLPKDPPLDLHPPLDAEEDHHTVLDGADKGGGGGLCHGESQYVHMDTQLTPLQEVEGWLGEKVDQVIATHGEMPTLDVCRHVWMRAPFAYVWCILFQENTTTTLQMCVCVWVFVCVCMGVCMGVCVKQTICACSFCNLPPSKSPFSETSFALKFAGRWHTCRCDSGWTLNRA